jgi:excisionase family DNA binding protein
MKMVPLSSEAMEFIPEVARPDAISQTIFSMTVFEPADGRDSSADRGPLSEATPQESGKTGLEEKEKPEKKILNEQDVAAILELKVEDVKRLIKKKRLRFIKLPGRKRGFTEEIIDEFIRNESGLPPRQGPGIEKLMAPRTPQGISLEESRALLRRLRKKDRA